MGERTPKTFNLPGHYFWFFNFVVSFEICFFFEHFGQNKRIELYKLGCERKN